MARVVCPLARRLLRVADVAYADGWVDAAERAPLYASERVGADEAMLHVARKRVGASRPDVATPPTTAVSVDATRRGPLAHPELLAVATDYENDDALHDHQRDAIDHSLTVGDDGGLVAHGGVWVMPCGVGKTRGAARYAALVGGRAFVTVPNVEVGAQWEAEFARMGVTRVYVHGKDDGAAARMWRADVLDDPPAVVVMTYAALALLLRPPATAAAAGAGWFALACVHALEYATHVVDEGHMLPASTYRASLRLVRARVRLAVTANAARSDGRALADVVGPTLYHMTTVEAHEAGVAARVRCEVVRVPTHPALAAACRVAGANSDEQRALAVLNPEKMRALRALLAARENRKVLVYCDRLAALEHVAAFVARACADGRVYAGVFRGATSPRDRREFLRIMRTADACVGVLSKAGSASLDVRSIDTVVEVDVGDAGVQKLVQRVGRAQRTDATKQNGARLVCLVSDGTHEVAFAERRAHEFGADMKWRLLARDARALPDGFVDAVLQRVRAHRRRAAVDDGSSSARPAKRHRTTVVQKLERAMRASA